MPKNRAEFFKNLVNRKVRRVGWRGYHIQTPGHEPEILPPRRHDPPSDMNDCILRSARPEDRPGAYLVCLKTGDHGRDAERFFRDDPEALGRIFVGPYLAYETEFSLILEDGEGICGYAFGALDSRAFYARYESEWRRELCARFPAPQGDPSGWTRTQQVHDCYHHPDYFCPEPYAAWPSHLHIDLLPRAQGRGYGRRMMEEVLERLRRRGSPGAHLGLSFGNTRAFGFYQKLGFRELCRVGSGPDGTIYMGKSLKTDSCAPMPNATAAS
jgi:ribosomal protein S18 acetylase RimI-like enzyme